MAMALRQREDWRNRPPPLGTRLSKKSPPPIVKPEALHKSKLAEAVNSVVAPVQPIRIDEETTLRNLAHRVRSHVASQEAANSAVMTASGSSSGGGGGDKEWYPTWEFDEHIHKCGWFTALPNLLRNANLMKPLGKNSPFIPDPDYSGKGECPLPQHTALVCEIRHDNVVSFKEATLKARELGRNKRANSFRSRGSVGLSQPIFRDIPGASKATGSREAIPQTSTSSPAYQRMKMSLNKQQTSDPFKYFGDPAFNDDIVLDAVDEWVSTYPGDTGEGSVDTGPPDGHDAHFESILSFSVNVALDITSVGYAQLSPSYYAWPFGGEMYVGRLVTAGLTYEKVYDEMEFYHVMETGTEMLILQDMENNSQVTDSACEGMFSLSTEIENEFLAWDEHELTALQQMIETSIANRDRRNDNPMCSTFEQPALVYSEIQRWEDEELGGLLSLGVSRCTEEEVVDESPPPSTPSKAPDGTEERWPAVCLRMTEEPYLRYQYWLKDNYEPNRTREDSYTIAATSRAKIGTSNVTPISEVVKAHKDLVMAMCTTTTPWVESVEDRDGSMMLPVKKINPLSKALKRTTSRVSRFFNRIDSWLSEPAFQFGGDKDSPPDKVTKEADEAAASAEVEMASEVIYRKVLEHGSYGKACDLYDIKWLSEREGDKPLPELSSTDVTNKVVYAVQSEDQREIFTSSGIYIGKRSRLEQVDEGSGLLLLNHKVPPKTA